MVFEDTEDARLTSLFYKFNTYAFDSRVPEQTSVRWGKIYATDYCGVLGGQVPESENSVLGRPHIFIDDRLKDRAFVLVLELTLIHEMCHFTSPHHDAAFVKEFLRALQRQSWEPIVGKCVPEFRIESLEE